MSTRQRPTTKIFVRYLTDVMRQNEWSYFLTCSDFNHPLILRMACCQPPTGMAVENAVFTDANAWIAGIRWDFTDNMSFTKEVENYKDREHQMHFQNGDRDFVLIRLGDQTDFESEGMDASGLPP